MEKTINNDKNTYNESLSLNNRKNLKIEGLVEINSSSDTFLSIKMRDTTLSIEGQNLNITKLDITTGTLEVKGIVNSIKYGKSGNLFKRIFK